MIYSENILLCIGIPLLLCILYSRDRTRRFVAALLIGMCVSLLSSYISGYLALLAGKDPEYAALYISPLVEETMKLLPLLFYLAVIRPEELDLATFAVALGSGFATFENCCYLLAAGAEDLAFTLARGLAVGVMHIVCMLALSLAIILVRRFRVFTLAAISGALALSVTFHSLYNLLVSRPGASMYIGYIMPLAAAGLFYWPWMKLRAPDD